MVQRGIQEWPDIFYNSICPMEPAKLTHLNSKCVMHHGQSRRSYPTDLLKRSIQCNDFKFYQRLMSGLQQYKLGRKLTRNWRTNLRWLRIMPPRLHKWVPIPFFSLYLRYVLPLGYLKKERKLEHPEANHPKLGLQMGKRWWSWSGEVVVAQQ